jgi:hypothetical protein
MISSGIALALESASPIRLGTLPRNLFRIRDAIRANSRARKRLACVHETIRPSSCSRARVGVPTS